MAEICDFNYFDPDQEYSVTYGDLPHWEQEGATQFVTFRTSDSIPISLMKQWKREREHWLAIKTKNDSPMPWFEKHKLLSAKQKLQFSRVFRHKHELELDKNHGECLLRQRIYGQIVADALIHFDGQRYHLGDFVVMPNHVHVLVCLFPSVRLREQCYSWKRFTSGKINKLRGCGGKFWQTESFDHLVRDLEKFYVFQKYIRENPIRAGLSKHEFIHYHL